MKRYYLIGLMLILTSLGMPVPWQTNTLYAQNNSECDTFGAAAEEAYDAATYVEAQTQYQAAVACYQEAGDRENEGLALKQLGHTYRQQKLYDEALVAYEAALLIMQEVGDRGQEGLVLYTMGRVYRSLGDYAQALTLQQETLLIDQELGYRTKERLTLYEMGQLYEQLNDYENALETFEATLVIDRELEDEEHTEWTLHRIGWALKELGQYDEALETLNEALALTRSLDNRAREGIVLNDIGVVYDFQANYAEAINFYEAAAAIHREVDARREERLSMNNLAVVYGKSGQLEAAIDAYQRVLALDRAFDNQVDEQYTLYQLGRIYQEHNDPEAALQTYQDAIALETGQANTSEKQYILIHIGTIYYNQNNPEQALEPLEAALTLTDQLDDFNNQAAVVYYLGQIYRDLGQTERAFTLLEETLAANRAADNKLAQLTTLAVLGSVYLEIQDEATALATYEEALALSLELNLESWQSTIRTILSKLQQGDTGLDAAPNDAVALCEQGRELYIGDQNAAAQPLLEAALAQREIVPAAALDNLGFCGWALAMIYEDDLNKSVETLQITLEIYQTTNNLDEQQHTWGWLGRRYEELEQFEPAIDAYQEALRLARDSGNLDEQLDALRLLGRTYEKLDQFEPTLEAYQEALELARQTEDLFEQYFILDDMAELYEAYEDYDAAIETLQDLVLIHQTRSDISGEIFTNSDLGQIYRTLTDYENALTHYKRALELSQEIRDPEREASALNFLGKVYQDQEQYQIALDYYEQSLQTSRQNDYKDGIYLALDSLGEVYEVQEDYLTALDYYEQALVVSRETDWPRWEQLAYERLRDVYQALERPAEAQAAATSATAIEQRLASNPDEEFKQTDLFLQELLAESDANFQEQMKILDDSEEWTGLVAAGLLAGVNDLQAAQQAYEQALALTDSLIPSSKSLTLTQLGGIYLLQGRYDAALELQFEAMIINESLEDQAAQGVNLNYIGEIYYRQGRLQDALETYQETLVLYQTIGDLRSEAQTLVNIAQIYFSQTQYDEALEIYNEAQVVYDAAGLPNRSAILRGIAQVMVEQDNYEKALINYDRVLRSYQAVGFRAGQGPILNEIGSLYLAQDQPQSALEFYSQALTINREMGRQPDMAHSLYQLGLVYEALEQPEAALESYLAAIDLIETIRATAGGDQGRTSFIAQYTDLYDAAIALLHDQNQVDLIFSITERSRARTFLDSLATGQVELSDIEVGGLLVQEQWLYQQQQSLTEALDQAQQFTTPNSPQVEALTAQLETTQASYRDIQKQLDARDERVSNLILGRGLQNVLETAQVQELLDEQTVLLSFYTTDQLSLAFVITQQDVTLIDLNLARSDLAEKINFFRNALDLQQGVLTKPTSQDLYEMLIAPVAQHLDQPRLVIVPHGPLHYLPFAALQHPDTAAYMVEQYEIVSLPTASALPFIQANTKEKATTPPLIIGNPTVPKVGLDPLPFAELEAEIIADIYGTQSFIGPEATETQVREQASQASILHLAAHGDYNEETPLDSLIALAPDDSHDGILTVGEVYGLDLQQTDMVVLSACQTQLGELSAGDEVVGLTRAFFFAGTPSVVASLWNVNDAATGLLMTQFYTHLDNGMSKAAALRQAQLDLIKDDTFADPFFWSAFVLSGDGGAVGLDAPVIPLGLTESTSSERTSANESTSIESNKSTPSLAEPPLTTNNTTERTANMGQSIWVGLIGMLIVFALGGVWWWRRRLG